MTSTFFFDFMTPSTSVHKINVTGWEMIRLLIFLLAAGFGDTRNPSNASLPIWLQFVLKIGIFFAPFCADVIHGSPLMPQTNIF